MEAAQVFATVLVAASSLLRIRLRFYQWITSSDLNVQTSLAEVSDLLAVFYATTLALR